MEKDTARHNTRALLQPKEQIRYRLSSVTAMALGLTFIANACFFLLIPIQRLN